MYYLDSAATSRPLPEVVEKNRECLRDYIANPSSAHILGVKARQLIEESRKTLATIFGVSQAGVLFCGSGTESDNLALKGVFNRKKGGKLVTSRMEHAAILNSAKWLEERGVQVEYVAVNPQTGLVDLSSLEELVDDKTRMVSIQHVNSETGVVQELSSISKVIKAKNSDTLLHSDGVQAFSKIPIQLKEMGVDLYSLSAHKFHGIKGVGALIQTGAFSLVPLLHGGGQEGGLRSGTENVAGIAAMSLAAQIAVDRIERNRERVEQFSWRFKRSLSEWIPDVQIFDSPHSIPHIISLSIPGIPGEVLLHHLAERGIFVSTGSACNASAKKLSATLQALAFSQQRIVETIRVSLAEPEIPDDFEAFWSSFAGVIKELRAVV